MTEKKQATIMDEEKAKVEEKEIIVAPETAITPQQNEAAFLEESAENDDDAQIPILKLAQKDEHAGSFYCDDMDLAFPDGIKVVLLKLQSACIMWPEKFSKDSEPLCKSDDGISPSPAVEAPMCAEDACCQAVFNKQTRHMEKPCTYGNWADDNPPACKDSFNLLLLEVGEESYIPYWYTVKSTSMSPFKKFKKTLNLRKRALTAKRRRGGLPAGHSCMFTFEMSTKIQENDGGNAYIPEFNNLQEIDDPQTVETLVAIAMETNERQLAHSPEDADSAGGTSAKSASEPPENF